MNKRLIAIGFAAMLLTACGGGEETTEEEGAADETAAACTYSYDSEATVLTWTAFKLTERVGVNGSFDQINVTANDGAENMFDVLNGATFEIPVSSLNSQDPERDPKLKKHFFGNMVETESITGSIIELNESSGKIKIKMNGNEIEYEGDVTVEGETITWEQAIDIIEFQAQASMDSIAVHCAEKHTGTDGVNKFWPDVNIAVKTTLLKECK